MARRCKVCEHPERKAIDKALVSGQTPPVLSQAFGVSLSSLYRHRKTHLPALLAKATPKARELAAQQQGVEQDELAHAFDIVQQLKAINAASLEVLQKARQQAEYTTLLQAVDRIHRQIGLQSKLLREMPEPQESRDLEEEWVEIRQIVVTALEPYPEARIAVAKALTDAAR